jgi:hypothetical protein
MEEPAEKLDPKAQLEIEKLTLEIGELRRWWKPYLPLVVSVIVGASTLFLAYKNGWFDVQLGRLEIRRAEISKENDQLEEKKTGLTAQVAALTEQVGSLKKQRDVAVSQARTNTLRAQTNQELSSEASDLAGRLREFQASADKEESVLSDAQFEARSTARITTESWKRDIAQMSDLKAKQRVAFEPMREEAVMLKQKIFPLLPKAPKPQGMSEVVLNFGYNGRASGTELATYIALLGSLLPQGNHKAHPQPGEH